VTASLPGYSSVSEDNVLVDLWETTESNFILEEISAADPPQNLIITTYYNNASLNWEMPGTEQIIEDKSNHRDQADIISRTERSFTGYKVYRNEELIAEVFDLFTTSYDDLALPQGEYTYYITAVYSDGESDPSNSEVVDIVLAPPENLTYNINGSNVVILQWDTPAGDEHRNVTGFRVYRDDVLLAEPVVEIEITSTENNMLPLETSLGVNHPNPFNPNTTISFQLSSDSKVELSIFNIKGEKVKQLVSDQLSAGQHSVTWDGEDENGKSVASGIYFYKMKTPNYRDLKKMIMLK